MDDVAELLERAATHGVKRGAPAVWSTVIAKAAEPSAEDPDSSALEIDLDARPVEVHRLRWSRFAIAAVIVTALAAVAGGVLMRTRRDHRSPTATFPTDLAPTPHWRVSPDHVPTPDSRAIDIEVEETTCASGQSAAGRIKAAVTFSADEVAIAVTVTPLPGGGRCPSNPVTPYTVSLDEALGSRRIVGENWPQPTGTSPPPSTTSEPVPTFPRAWSVSITATVLGDDGSEPFTLRSTYPVTFTAVGDPVIATLEATAPEPLLVTGSPDLFSAHLTGAGVLDIAGPVCVEGGPMFKRQLCSADPAVLPIGVTYGEVTASKPTGPVLDSRYLRIGLDARALQPGTYTLQEEVSWVSARASVDAPYHTATVTIRFEASQVP